MAMVNPYKCRLLYTSEDRTKSGSSEQAMFCDRRVHDLGDM